MSTELKDLKPGDEVIYDPPGFFSKRRVAKIDRVTTTLIVIGVSRFNRQTGSAAGQSGYSLTYSGSISVPEPGQVDELRAEANRQDLARRVSYVKWDTLSTAQLEQVAAIVFQPTKTPQ